MLQTGQQLGRVNGKTSFYSESSAVDLRSEHQGSRVEVDAVHAVNTHSRCKVFIVLLRSPSLYELASWIYSVPVWAALTDRWVL
jgi:hypothetical protein